MEATMKAIALVPLLLLPLGAANAAGVAGQSALTVPLACAISHQKVVVITNSTGHAISAGTPMAFDAIRLDGKHYGKSFHSPLMPANGAISIGAEPSLSCTASYTRQLMMAPSP
jgi:hypothetical protein